MVRAAARNGSPISNALHQSPIVAATPQSVIRKIGGIPEEWLPRDGCSPLQKTPTMGDSATPRIVVTVSESKRLLSAPSPLDLPDQFDRMLKEDKIASVLAPTPPSTVPRDELLSPTNGEVTRAVRGVLTDEMRKRELLHELSKLFSDMKTGNPRSNSTPQQVQCDAAVEVLKIARTVRNMSPPQNHLPERGGTIDKELAPASGRVHFDPQTLQVPQTFTHHPRKEPHLCRPKPSDKLTFAAELERLSLSTCRRLLKSAGSAFSETNTESSKTSNSKYFPKV